jgi:Mn-dependent DtxR family transcriptional regulator
MMLVRGLVERDSTGGLKMTPKGREVFKVLIGG